MPNIVITSTTNCINVDFGDYASSVGYKKGCWRKDKVLYFTLLNGESGVSASLLMHGKFDIAYTASAGNMIVDSVNSVAPTSNSDLYDKLIALMG